jgi:hypothetical protein
MDHTPDESPIFILPRILIIFSLAAAPPPLYHLGIDRA